MRRLIAYLEDPEGPHGLLYPRTFLVVEGILVVLTLASVVMAVRAFMRGDF